MNASVRNGSTARQSLNDLGDAEIRDLYFDWRIWARDDQLPPEDPEAWRVWLLLGGRGAGKTRAGAEWVRAQALGLWDGRCSGPRRIALIGETFADVRRVMIEGASGLLGIHPPHERPVFEASNGRVVWPNGSVAHVFSSETPDSLRGPQFEFAWCDAFVGAMLENAGQRSTRSLRARSYLNWGVAIEHARSGAVAVLARGRNAALGHVGFVVGETEDALILLGGNQANSVSVHAFDRSRLLGLRWPERPDRSRPVKSVSGHPVPVDRVDAFEAEFGHVLKMEGGFSDDPFDPGGPTNYGITLRTYANYVGRTVDASSRPALLADLVAISPDTVRAIYLKRYWAPARCAELPAGLALMHFDAAVNHGVGAAIRCLQAAVHVAADGEIGPLTRRAIEAAAPRDAIVRYAALREQRYRALPHFWRFGRGWLRRVAATKAAALSITDRDTAGPRFELSPSTQSNGEQAMTPSQPAQSKWWGHSLTVWGAAVTAAAAILPALGPLIGLDITSETVRQIGSDVGAIAQAVAGVIGTLMTLYGRSRATAPLARREMNVRL